MNDVLKETKYVEVETIIGNMQEGDRVHFFWEKFIDGSTLNGGCNIIKVSNEIGSLSKNKLKDHEIDLFKTLRQCNGLVTVTLKLDYHDPTEVVMVKNKGINVIRKE